MNAQLKKLDELNVKPVILSLFKPYSESFMSRSQHVLTMPDLYDPSHLKLSYPDLLKQSKENFFYRHRAGRIGASVSWTVAHSNPMQPSQSLIKSLRYLHLFKVTSKAISNGKK